MKFRAYITTYDRPKDLARVVKRLSKYGIEPVIFEDGVTHPHRGKRYYWKTWKEILQDAKENEADIYLFMPDDFHNIAIRRIEKLHKQHNKKPYVYNLINDGREKCWTGVVPFKFNKETELIGFTDCGFFCNREALKVIKFDFVEPSERWQRLGKSSGVGMNLTRAFALSKVDMFRPFKSLAYHGEHDSKMHPEERKNNPLISK